MTASSWTGTPATVTGSESSSPIDRTYKLQLESGGADLLIDGVYFAQRISAPERRHALHSAF